MPTRPRSATCSAGPGVVRDPRGQRRVRRATRRGSRRTSPSRVTTSIGAALLAEHFPRSRELHLLAVRRDRHRQGIGRLLVDSDRARPAGRRRAAARGAHRRAVARGARAMPGPRAFYEAVGFVADERAAAHRLERPDADPGQAAVSVDPVGVRRGARAAGAVRRAHALPAAAGDGQGARAVRHRRSADRPAVAAALPRHRRGPGRDPARLRRTPLLGAGLRPSAGDGGVPQRLDLRLRRPARPAACAARPSIPRPAQRTTSRPGSRRAPRSSRSTCRSARSTCATRSWPMSGACSRTPAPRSSSTPARARSGRRTPGRDRSPTCWPAHPRLALVIAHLGAPEYAEFVALAEAYERVCVDTTMVFTDFFDDLGAAFPPDLVPRLRDLQPKVLLGLGLPEHPVRLRQPARAG